MTVIKGRQAETVEFLAYAMFLLKDKIFDKAMKAINDEDTAEFAKVCEEAGIPKEVDGVCDDMYTALYAMLRAGMTEYPDMYAWP